MHSSLFDPAESERRLAAAGLGARVVVEHEGEFGPIGREREDYLRSIGVVDDDRTERMVVVEGRLSA